MAEDNNINQVIAKKLFQKLGYSIDLAKNGIEAITAVYENKYDMVFMDCQMPVMDGITATKEIHRLYGEKRPKVIAISANAFIEDQKNYLKAGMDDFIAKPVDIEKLREIIIRNSSTDCDKKIA